MTQQDETRQYAATDQSGPSVPSPYLDASEAAPQAYPAPPQPDQPGYGQAGSRPLRGAQPRRDASIAAPWERLAAAVLDWIIIVGVSVLAFWSPLVRVWRELNAITSTYQDLGSPAAQAAINNIARDPAYLHALQYWFVGIFGIALAYYWVQHAAWGATLGKRVVGVRVVQANDHARIGVQTAGIRTVAFLAGPAAFLMLASPVNVAGGLLWVADTGLTMLDPRAQCLHDKMAGTLVMKKRWLDQQTRPAAG